MTKKFLKKSDVGALITSVVRGGSLFVAPVEGEDGQVFYSAVSEEGVITTDHILPKNSFKEFFFPQTEVIATFAGEGNKVSLDGVEPNHKTRVIFGARPCEAKSMASMTSVFTWDFIDEFYTRREDGSVVMSLACTASDDACFCTTVGEAPDGKEGSDILLRETEDGDFIAEMVTDRGKQFVDKHTSVFGDKVSGKVKAITTPEKVPDVDMDKIKKFLGDKENFDHPVWAELSRKCVGCGACTYSCCTCHCFDITDEGTYYEGERRKNWDACQFDHFTVHAFSGHNPRETQGKRWRNRFMCKFHIYPTKWDKTGCVGCGRCIRVCSVRHDITEVMAAISKL